MSQLSLWDDEPPVSADAAPRFSPGQLARLLGIDEPTPEQSAVISAPLAPMAVIAGAGSGKSETMAARLVWLVANGYVRPERVLGLTFTRKAAAEMQSRLAERLLQLATCDDAELDATVVEGLKLRVVAGPAFMQSGSARAAQMAHDVAVGIEEAVLGNRTGLDPLLPPRLAQQRVGREDRGGAMVLAAQDRWEALRPGFWAWRSHW